MASSLDWGKLHQQEEASLICGLETAHSRQDMTQDPHEGRFHQATRDMFPRQVKDLIVIYIHILWCKFKVNINSEYQYL